MNGKKLNNEQNMRTYKKIKSMFKSEPYIHLKDGQQINGYVWFGRLIS